MSEQPPHPPHEPPAPDDPREIRRRKFINVSLGASLAVWCGSAVYPVTRYLFPPEGPAIEESSVKVGPESDFPKPSGTLFRIGNKPGLLVRTASGEFRAYIAICTHLDCTVQYKEDESIIWCACHNGKYNLQGANIAGPPPRPLQPLEVAQKGEDIYVSLPT